MEYLEFKCMVITDYGKEIKIINQEGVRYADTTFVNYVLELLHSNWERLEATRRAMAEDWDRFQEHVLAAKESGRLLEDCNAPDNGSDAGAPVI